MKRILSAFSWAAAACAVVAAFVSAGRWSPSPLRWGDVRGWIDKVPPQR